MRYLPRSFLFSAAGSALLLSAPATAQQAASLVGQTLPAWQAGELDIHHINTGRGEASFFHFPDGTNMLVDASGKTVESAPFTLPTRPNASRPPAQWVARYVQNILTRNRQQIDYAVMTHFHGDHIGAVVGDSPLAKNGQYQLSGITEIAEHLRIAKLIDRGWPDYQFPTRVDSRNMQNYRRFAAWQHLENKMAVERFAVGQSDQIRLKLAPEKYPQFRIQNIYANGYIWTGEGSGVRDLVPARATLKPSDFLDENKLSIAFRLSYGKFDYFSGGDLSAKEDDALSKAKAWHAVEPVVGRVTGRVEAMKANHHGSWDSNGVPFLRALRPRTIVIASRADGHPAVNSYQRMISQSTWRGPRDIFITNVSDATRATTYGVEKAASTQGHVVIRVASGGDSYRVFVLDDSDERRRVKAVFGPYQSE